MSTDDVLANLTAIKTEVESAHRNLARAQARKDQAEAAEAEALAELKKLGYETPQAALDGANAVRDSVAKRTETIKQKLQEAVQ